MLRQEEGKLFDPADGQFVRNTNRQDHVDVIERVLYLTPAASRRFCRFGSPRVSFVETCDNCFSSADNGGDGVPDYQQTCMDTDLNTLFIRSRIKDVRGRRWVTGVRE